MNEPGRSSQTDLPRHTRARDGFEQVFGRSARATIAAMDAAGDDVADQSPAHPLALRRMGVRAPRHCGDHCGPLRSAAQRPVVLLGQRVRRPRRRSARHPRLTYWRCAGPPLARSLCVVASLCSGAMRTGRQPAGKRPRGGRGERRAVVPRAARRREGQGRLSPAKSPMISTGRARGY